MLPRQAQLGRRHAAPAARSLSRAAAAIAALAIAGCGGDDEPAQRTGVGPEAELELELTRERGARPETASLSCPGDDDPGPCLALGEVPADAFKPVPADAVCTQIFGGEDRVRISGTLEGEAIDTTLTRTDGCEIERFDPFVALLRGLFDGYRPGGLAPPR